MGQQALELVHVGLLVETTAAALLGHLCDLLHQLLGGVVLRLVLAALGRLLRPLLLPLVLALVLRRALLPLLLGFLSLLLLLLLLLPLHLLDSFHSLLDLRDHRLALILDLLLLVTHLRELPLHDFLELLLGLLKVFQLRHPNLLLHPPDLGRRPHLQLPLLHGLALLPLFLLLLLLHLLQTFPLLLDLPLRLRFLLLPPLAVGLLHLLLVLLHPPPHLLLLPPVLVEALLVRLLLLLLLLLLLYVAVSLVRSVRRPLRHLHGAARVTWRRHMGGLGRGLHSSRLLVC
mmetsp:Transcript_91246/g.282239  ORF Transcript_91246/g.282239 Transcript_91246/m.282239 type:complete len:288 (-) Transcript_91246:693-1556(-)